MVGLIVGDRALDADDVVAWGRRPTGVALADGVAARLRDNADMAERIAAEAVSYGRSTGVGANRDIPADDRDGGHGRRLVRSHATGAGADLGDAVAHSTMLVRLNQLAGGGSGIPLGIVEALCAAADAGMAPPVRMFGGMGTGDITGLAELALCLLGERPWRDGSTQTYLHDIRGNGALALISSSAPTIAMAAHATIEAERFLSGSLLVSALSTLAVRPNPQQWSHVVETTRPSAGLSWASGAMRVLLDGCSWMPARTQDPLSFRVTPFVAGPYHEALGGLRAVVDVEINARAENPRYEQGAVWHHGAFTLTGLALALDHARLAATQWCSTSLARLTKLLDPAYTGQGRFLAHGPAGSSGLMVLEYTAGSALETVRTLADPTSRHTATVSLGVEDHATMASRGAIAAREQLVAARTVVACELVAAVRALRHVDDIAFGPMIQAALDRCATLPEADDDRPLIDDVATAVELVDALDEIVRPQSSSWT